jgi:uncharacterized repeat protein (TIGR03803 family)
MLQLRPFRIVSTLVAFCVASALVSPAQTFQTLVSFDLTDGAYSYGALIQGADGNFYGTTYTGGANGEGAVFEVTPGGTLNPLYSFCSLSSCADGIGPYAGLVQGTDGNFYGTTPSGGANGAGTVFEVTPGGTLTTLYSFCSLSSCADGIGPYAGLMQGTDGNFYGTTSTGGANHVGTVFQITPAGTLTTLHSFCSLSKCGDGSDPGGELVQGADGNFYGTTAAGGASIEGTVFKITPEGILTTLYSFCSLSKCADGAGPRAGLVQGTDGNFYGTTYADGANSGGTAFQITPGGTLNTLYSLCSWSNCADGSGPWGGLVEGTDGNFYGAALFGGNVSAACDNGCGTVYKLSPQGFLAPSFTPLSLEFGNQAADTTGKAKTVTIKNLSTGTLAFSDFSVSASFAISANTCGATLKAGKTCRVSTTFTPTVVGASTGVLSVYDNATVSPQSVTLSGTGIPQVTLTPGSLTFANTKVGKTSARKSITLKSNLPTELSDISYSTTGSFSVSSSTCSTTLGSNRTCTIGVTFIPTATGLATGTLSVSDSANNSPLTVSLSGTGD